MVKLGMDFITIMSDAAREIKGRLDMDAYKKADAFRRELWAELT